MKFWLLVCACVSGGMWYSIATSEYNVDASIIKKINPSCSTIRAWEKSRLRGQKAIGLPAPNEERLLECFPSYEGKDYLIEDHFRYADYLENQMMRNNK